MNEEQEAIEEVVEEEKRPCPRCGSDTDWDLDCPGYRSTRNGEETIMVCYPACGNAEVLTCTNDDCTWWWATAWRRSPLYGVPMGKRPEWFRSIGEVEEEADEEEEFVVALLPIVEDEHITCCECREHEGSDESPDHRCDCRCHWM